jgi:peptide/nickel transport system permease protein
VALPWRAWRTVHPTKAALAGSVLFVAFVALGAATPLIAPHDPARQELRAKLLPPVGFPGSQERYPLGSDMLGRDLLTQILYGIRVSLAVGMAGVGLASGLGILLGLAAGYHRGALDGLIMRAADVQFSLPLLLVAMAAIALWGRGLGKLIVVLGVAGWAEYGRTLRASVVAVREQEYVQAVRAQGAGSGRIMGRHILPNALTPVLVLVVVNIPRVMILEATLSFLGLGVPITTPSLGIAIALGYNYLLSGAWWVSILPGAVLMLIVLSVNLVGDWLRERLDPRLRHSTTQ